MMRLFRLVSHVVHVSPSCPFASAFLFMLIDDRATHSSPRFYGFGLNSTSQHYWTLSHQERSCSAISSHARTSKTTASLASSLQCWLVQMSFRIHAALFYRTLSVCLHGSHSNECVLSMYTSRLIILEYMVWIRKLMSGKVQTSDGDVHSFINGCSLLRAFFFCILGRPWFDTKRERRSSDSLLAVAVLLLLLLLQSSLFSRQAPPWLQDASNLEMGCYT